MVYTIKTCVKRPLSKRPKSVFSRPIIVLCMSKVLQNAPRGAFCNTLTFIKLPFVIKIFVLSICEWTFNTCFTAVLKCYNHPNCVHKLGLFKVFELTFSKHMAYFHLKLSWLHVCNGFQYFSRFLERLS